MNIYEFNQIVYKGNISRDFYLFCLRKNIKLIKYFFLNIIYFIISMIFDSKKQLYQRKKYIYLKQINELDNEVKKFYAKKNRYNSYIEGKKDIIIDRVPKILIESKMATEIIGYELDDNFEVCIDKYNKEVLKIKKADKLYLRNRYKLENIYSNKIFIVNNNKLHFIKKRKKLNKKVIILLVLVIISIFLTCVSFCYTNYLLDIEMYLTYFEPKLFLMNFIPIFFIILLLFFISKRIHISFLITSILIITLGVANQTKILYRDDIVKFEDLLVFKEAMTMSERYDVVIKKYTIISIVLVLIIFFILKRFLPKIKANRKKRMAIIFLTIMLLLFNYKLLYTDDKIYDSLGDKSLINVWIGTRQYQIRGLIYPFIYTLEDGMEKKPDNYDEKIAKEILKKYDYENIPDDKKVNIIAIMLEAYNDFSKFEKIDFNEDIYKEFHEIQNISLHGNLITTIFGGGTIVTERNFLTGYYNTPDFRKNTNSYVWYFKEQGYRTEAMHPIFGAFYNRTSVAPNIGFDAYYNYDNKFSKISDDFLNDIDFFDYIIEGYESSKTENIPYFNFSVTYQNHGPYYSGEYEKKEYFFDNDGYNIEAYNTINEYFSGIKKTNEALGKIINYFEKEEEPTIIIIFGDHNPYLGENALAYNEVGINLDLSTEEGFLNYYETPYIIYGNNSAKKVFNKSFIGNTEDISPIFLMNELFDYCDLKGNEYLQYMSDLKINTDVINKYYYKEDGKYVKTNKSNYYDKIKEYENVNYYYSRNYGGKK